MTEPNIEPSQTASSWDAYWQGTGETGAYSNGGANHPALLTLWNEFFTLARTQFSNPVMLDIASGNGAVIERALNIFDGNDIEIHCVDISQAAITNIQSRFGSVTGLEADAGSIPLPDAKFDIVTSQFGVEYAGREAFHEAARLLAAGGQLGLLAHSQAGSIHRECSINLEAITRLRNSGFLAGARDMFRAGFEAVRGADRKPYDEAAKRLAPAVAEAEAIMQEMGSRVADDTVVRLYNDVARIHKEIQHYDPDEVLNWLERMDAELATYSGRMSSMTQAAMDEATFESICGELIGQHRLVIDQAGPLLGPDNEIPLAWVLVAHKES